MVYFYDKWNIEVKENVNVMLYTSSGLPHGDICLYVNNKLYATRYNSSQKPVINAMVPVLSD